MGKNRPSFFERLTGTVNIEQEDNESLDILDQQREDSPESQQAVWENNEPEPAELAVDIYQTPTHIILQTMVAGVRPEDLDISITREAVSINGRREGPRNIGDNDWSLKELYWGDFTRTITLPQEIETEGAEATENHGLLIIKMPKIDRERKMKIKVQSR